MGAGFSADFNQLDGSYAVTGSFEATVDFNGTLLTSAGSTDTVVSLYTAGNQLYSATRSGGTGTEIPRCGKYYLGW